MAYPADLISTKFTFDYVSSNIGSDIQEFGINGRREGGSGTGIDWPTDLQTVADGLRDAWNSGTSGFPASWFSPSVSGKMVQAYQMDTTFHAVSSASSSFSGGDAFTGSASAGLPPQCSVVCTLWKDDPAHFVSHRARRRGRFYLPTFGTSELSGDGALYAAHASAVLFQLQAFLQACIAITLSDGASFKPVIVSRVGQSTEDVVYCGVGEVVDTQRRRRNKLTEKYATTLVI